MINRREAIEQLCDLFLSEESDKLKEYREMYKDLIRPLLPNSLPFTEIGKFVENVGDELFASRPGSMPYIVVFLEFTSQLNVRAEGCKEVIKVSAANVIERTEFNPLGRGQRILVFCANFFLFFVNKFLT